ncbi:MAG: ABC transporter, substrate-binding protein (cluster 5, nickel/peptides/opines) [uncultured Caballeronia sp.]|nr:MAG: ABC transporter, substrate-binding protein (cluster 5, nickel/peptides/opines) [uncultured Caballeronia sp.]
MSRAAGCGATSRKRFDNGELIKREFPQHNGTGMQGFFMNTRKPLFKDVRVHHTRSISRSISSGSTGSCSSISTSALTASS